MHIYATGNHDFGVRQNEKLPSSWPQLAVRWLRSWKPLSHNYYRGFRLEPEVPSRDSSG